MRGALLSRPCSGSRLLVFVLLARAFVDGGLVVSFDDNVSRWVADNVPGWVEQIARVVTWLGGAIGAGVVTAVALVVLWRSSRRADALFLGGAVVGITVLVAVLKNVYERARPDLGTVIALPHSYSFPSGHAATAVVLYGALGILRPSERARGSGPLPGSAEPPCWHSRSVPAACCSTSTSVSDVAAGFAVGLAWLCCCAIVRDVLRGQASAASQPFIASSRLRAAGWLVGAALLALAIGSSRVLLNVHFVSDVAAGFAVGLAWLCCCAIVRELTRSGRDGHRPQDPPVADQENQPLAQLLEELGAQLDWVREYLDPVQLTARQGARAPHGCARFLGRPATGGAHLHSPPRSPARLGS